MPMLAYGLFQAHLTRLVVSSSWYFSEELPALITNTSFAKLLMLYLAVYKAVAYIIMLYIFILMILVNGQLFEVFTCRPLSSR